MTSTLPNFAASPAIPAGPASPNAATLAGFLTSSGASPAPATPTGGMLLEFAALLPQGGLLAKPTGADPATPAVSVATATPATPAASVAPVAGAVTSLEGPVSSDCFPDLSLTETAVASCQTMINPGRTISALASTHVTPAKVSTAAPTPARPHGISREEFEQAAAFVAALMQTLQPAAVAVPAPAPEAGSVGSETSAAALPEQPVALPAQSAATPVQAITPVPTATLAQAATPVAATPVSVPGTALTLTNPELPNGRAFPSGKTDTAKPLSGQVRPVAAKATEPVVAGEEVAVESPVAALTLPNGRAFAASLPDQAKPALGEGRAVPANLPAQSRPVVPAARPVPMDEVSGSDLPVEAPVVSGVEAGAVTPTSSEPVFTLAADGAIELKLTLPASRESGLETSTRADAPLEVYAELELPGQAVIRVEATVPQSSELTEPARAVNFAGLKASARPHRQMKADTFERNFVFAGDKQVKTSSPESGITVAKTESTMSVVPTEETRTTRNPEAFSALPLRADFQVVQSPAERITVAPTEPAGQNFAERAVATVTGLAEAQFSASMHKAGSVQLRLKFGGEDLSVRVELRDGAVHTDFRTDSPELRAALAKEWQAVAASSPGQLQRFLDPVFSPASPSSAADAGAQHHAFHRQSSQQQANEQAASRQDAWHSQSPFSRRSALSESFLPEPAAPRVPVLLPTSLRLSVLA